MLNRRTSQQSHDQDVLVFYFLPTLLLKCREWLFSSAYIDVEKYKMIHPTDECFNKALGLYDNDSYTKMLELFPLPI